jgi:hypothetical protein
MTIDCTIAKPNPAPPDCRPRSALTGIHRVGNTPSNPPWPELPLTVCLTHELHFKQHYPRTQIIRVDVAGSAIFGTPRFPYKITGLGLSFVPPNFDRSLLDVAYSVSDQLAFSYCHQIAQCEGLLLGASTD